MWVSSAVLCFAAMLAISGPDIYSLWLELLKAFNLLGLFVCAAPIRGLFLEMSRLSGFEEMKCIVQDVFPAPRVTWETEPPTLEAFKPFTRMTADKRGLYTVDSRLKKMEGKPDLIYICKMTPPYGGPAWTSSLRERGKHVYMCRLKYQSQWSVWHTLDLKQLIPASGMSTPDSGKQQQGGQGHLENRQEGRRGGTGRSDFTALHTEKRSSLKKGEKTAILRRKTPDIKKICPCRKSFWLNKIPNVEPEFHTSIQKEK